MRVKINKTKNISPVARKTREQEHKKMNMISKVLIVLCTAVLVNFVWDVYNRIDGMVIYYKQALERVSSLHIKEH